MLSAEQFHIMPWTIVAVMLVAIIVPIVTLKFLPIPFCWIGLIWGITALAIAPRATSLMQFLLLIAASVSVALASGEAFLAVTGPPKIVDEMVPAEKADPLLGWKPEPRQVYHATKKGGDALIYDVSYSIDPAGHRISPPDRGEQVEGCLFFFANSFTFGEGVGDQETFPYQVGQKTKGLFRVVSFSYRGYGAEHMLAAIERGELATHPPCEPTHIFYAALPHHVARAAGKTSYSIYGPKYRLGPNSIPEYLGTKPHPPKSWWRWNERFDDQLSKSQIYRFLQGPTTTEEDIELYFGIVREAFRRFERRWPEVKLHVISWDIHDFYAAGKDRFHSGLKTIRAEVHLIDNILPGYTKDPTKYALHKFDLHPSPIAHEMVASYLTESVLYPSLSVNR